MKMRTIRRLKKLPAPRTLRRFDLTDVTIHADLGSAPEAVFDRITGPYGRGTASLERLTMAGSFDEET